MSLYVVNATRTARGGNRSVPSGFTPASERHDSATIGQWIILRKQFERSRRIRSNCAGPNGTHGSEPGGSIRMLAGGNGQFNLTSDQNTGGILTSPCSGTLTQCTPGTDTVATNGRVTLTDSGFQNSSPPQTLQPVLYLVSNNQAFIIGTDPAVSFGFMTPQTIPQSGFSSSSSIGDIRGRVACARGTRCQQRSEHCDRRTWQRHRNR